VSCEKVGEKGIASNNRKNEIQSQKFNLLKVMLWGLYFNHII
jgi:hypothetical protein